MPITSTWHEINNKVRDLYTTLEKKIPKRSWSRYANEREWSTDRCIFVSLCRIFYDERYWLSGTLDRVSRGGRRSPCHSPQSRSSNVIVPTDRLHKHCIVQCATMCHARREIQTPAIPKRNRNLNVISHVQRRVHFWQVKLG